MVYSRVTPALNEHTLGAGRFEIRRTLGEGGMGVVYAAVDRERGEECAIKTLRSLDADALFRLKSEFRALADVDHRNLVRFGELICDGDTWFVTMELIDGVPFLEAVRDEASALDLDKLRDALGQLCAGVMALHAAGKVHRDLKPANVLVEPVGRSSRRSLRDIAGEEEPCVGRVVILDFGLIIDPKLAGMMVSANIVGTAAYMAPEQAEADPISPAADWYAVGVMLYEALTGKLPFDGPPIHLLMKKIDRDPEPPIAVAPDVPASLSDLTMRLLARDPAARAGGEDILAWLSRERGAASPAPHASRRRRVAESIAQVPFIGREAEMLALEEAFASQAGAVLVAGPSGVGKTALVRELENRLQAAHDVAILRGRCYERESVPYKGLDEAVDQLARFLAAPELFAIELPADLDALTRVFPVLRRAPVIAKAKMKVTAASGHDLRRRASSALKELFAALARQCAPVLIIDDLQWANADSLALLRDLCGPPVFTVATVRTEGDSEALDELARTLGGARVIALGGLLPEQAQVLAKTLWAQAGQHDLSFDAARIAQEAGGHPLFVDVLVRHQAERGGRVCGHTRLEDAIAARIADLDDDARALLTAVAVAGAPISQRLAARASHLETERAARLVSRLRAMRFVRTSGATPDSDVHPYHDRVREAALTMLDPAALQRTHASLVAAIESTAEDIAPARLVRHLEAAGEDARAARVAEKAAPAAASALAFDHAAELYEIALRLGTHTIAERHALAVKRAESLANAGRGLDAADLFLEAAKNADPGEAFDLRRRAADLLLRYGVIDRGMNIIAELMAALDIEYPRKQSRAMRAIGLASWRLKLARLRWRERTDDEIDADALRRLDLFTTLGLSLGYVDPLRSTYFRLRGLRLGLRLGATSRIALCMAGEAASSAYMGDFAVTERLLAVIDRVGQRGDRLARAHHSGVSGAMYLVQGRLARADALIRQSLAEFEQHTVGADWQIAVARIFHLFALRDAGRYRALCAAYDDYVRDALDRGDRFAAATMMRGLSLVWLVRGKPEVALREVSHFEWSALAEGEYHTQHLYELVARAEIALYRGLRIEDFEAFEDGYQAFRQAVLYRSRVERNNTYWTRGRMALALARAGEPPLIKIAKTSARMLGRLPLSGATIASALLLAGIAERTGRRDEACALYERVAMGEHEYTGRAMAARWRWGELCGGERGAALLAEAETWLRGQGVAEPRRLVDVIAPPRGEAA